jgi:hypothetical protein
MIYNEIGRFQLMHSNNFSFNSSRCSESQREAALLLGQFAATDSDCKVSIKTLVGSHVSMTPSQTFKFGLLPFIVYFLFVLKGK